MDSINTLLAALDGSPQTIALCAVGLVMLLTGLLLSIVLRRNGAAASQRQAHNSQPQLLPEAVIRQPRREVDDDPSPGTPSAVTEDPAFAEEEDDQQFYEVGDLDVLAEIDVFLEFGYLEQAALALRNYVDSPSCKSPGQLHRLAGLYLQLHWLEDYADTLERLHELSLLDRQQLAKAIFSGLQQDQQNLSLRVLAESRLGLGVSEVDQQLDSQMAVTESDARLLRTVSPAPLLDSDQEAPPPACLPPHPVERLALLQGSSALQPLQQREIQLITTLLPAERQASILMACHEPAAALPALQQLAAVETVTPARLIDTLRACYMTRNLPMFCRYLWQFHVCIGNVGHSLKQSLLQLGCQLGEHPVLQALESQPARLQLESIGRHFGYTAMPSAQSKPLPLVTANPGHQADTVLDNVLNEAEQFIVFGQTDMAMLTLENAILQSPAQAELYPPLLELYEHQSDLARFTCLARQIRDKLATPPEEITGMLARFVQNMQQGLRHSRIEA